MAGSSVSTEMQSADNVELMLQVLTGEEEEENDFYIEDDDLMIDEQNNGLTPIRDLTSNCDDSFRGVVRWKKECFTARNGQTRICRVRVGDDRDHKSFIQVTGFNNSAQWMQDNLFEGKVYTFEGVGLKNSNRRFVPSSHKCEGIFNVNLSTAKETHILSSDPSRLYYDLKSFGQVSQLRVSTCVETIGVVLKPDAVIKKGSHCSAQSPIRATGIPFSFWVNLANTINQLEKSTVKPKAIQKAVSNYKKNPDWEAIVRGKAKN